MRILTREEYFMLSIIIRSLLIEINISYTERANEILKRRAAKI